MERALTIVPGSGRERELDSIVAEFGLVSSGAARRVIVSGPQGIGKTWLLDAASRAFAAKGVAVARARGGRGTTAALGVARELAASLLEIARIHASGPAELRGISERLRSILGPTDDGRDEGPESRTAARLRQVEALAELFSVAGRRGAAIVLDDVDVADPGSRDLLSAVLAGLAMPGAGAGLLLVASWREAPADFGARIGELPGVDLALGRLDVDGVRSFLAEARLAERLLERTEGSLRGWRRCSCPGRPIWRPGASPASIPPPGAVPSLPRSSAARRRLRCCAKWRVPTRRRPTWTSWSTAGSCRSGCPRGSPSTS